jgi:hypothetical protein
VIKSPIEIKVLNFILILMMLMIFIIYFLKKKWMNDFFYFYFLFYESKERKEEKIMLKNTKLPFLVISKESQPLDANSRDQSGSKVVWYVVVEWCGVDVWW